MQLPSISSRVAAKNALTCHGIARKSEAGTRNHHRGVDCIEKKMEPADRRKHIRYTTSEGLYAIVRAENQFWGTVRDISRGGLDLVCVGDGPVREDGSGAEVALDLFSSGRDLWTVSLPCRIVASSRIGADGDDDTSGSPAAYNCRLSFEELPPAYRLLLDLFLKRQETAK